LQAFLYQQADHTTRAVSLGPSVTRGAVCYVDVDIVIVSVMAINVASTLSLLPGRDLQVADFIHCILLFVVFFLVMGRWVLLQFV
jgi:hypothetical protein